MRLPFAAAVLATTLAAPAAHALTLYDNFSATSLSSFRWNASEATDDDGVIVDSRRALDSGHMRLEAKSYGGTIVNAGAGLARFGMRLARSADVTALQATLTARTATTPACAGNSTFPSQVDLRLGGGFFNADRRTLPGDSLLNDVQAWIGLTRNANDATLTVSAHVVQCLNDACTISNTLGTATLGNTSLDIPIGMSVTWDKAGHQFAFTSGLVAGTAFVPYTVSDVQPAHDAAKTI